MKNLKKEYTIEEDLKSLEHNFCNVLKDFNDCFEVPLSEKKSKVGVVGSIFNLGKSITKLTLNTGSCAIKYAPKALFIASTVKRELINFGIEEWNQHQKELKKEALKEKIEQLKLKAAK